MRSGAKPKCFRNDDDHKTKMTMDDGYRRSYLDATNQYRLARKEHAWLLRAEGLSLREIAERLGITSSPEAVRVHIADFGKRVSRAMRPVTWDTVPTTLRNSHD